MKFSQHQIYGILFGKKYLLFLNEATYINYGIDINQKNFYKNLRKGKEQFFQTNGAILLINPIIGNIILF